jgi:hypothetical protein
MKDQDDGLTRRDFLRGAAGAALVGAAVGCSPEPGTKPKPAQEEKPPGEKKTKVVLVRDEKALKDGRKVDAEVLERMLDDGVKELLGETDAGKAWGRLVKADDVVGIKSNVWRFLPTPAELESALKDRVLAAGVAEDRISIDDRGVLRDPVFQKSTALINVRTLRTHHWSGVGSCIKNYIMFSEKPPKWHGDSCADLAGVWDLPICKGKTRLNILVMLTPLFHGKGPHHFNAKYTWEYKGLLLGTDPVAVDATGVRILEAKRKEYFGKDEPFATSPKHIRVAEEKHKLGVADPKKIELVKLGWQEGALI